MYDWIIMELRLIERDRTRLDNRMFKLMETLRRLQEKIEQDGIDRGETIDDC